MIKRKQGTWLTGYALDITLFNHSLCLVPFPYSLKKELGGYDEKNVIFKWRFPNE